MGVRLDSLDKQIWRASKGGDPRAVYGTRGHVPTSSAPNQGESDMLYQVHLKNELGHDSSMIVDAETERDAVSAAYDQHETIADVIDVFPIDASPDPRLAAADPRDERLVTYHNGEPVRTAMEQRAERANATKSGGYHLDLSNEAALRVGEAKEWAEEDKTAEAVREAHAACDDAVNSRQEDERAAELNRWHDDHRAAEAANTDASHGREDVR